MDTLVLIHLLFLGLWGGIVATESVIELGARDNDGRRIAAKLHFWIDLTVEMPVLLGVLITGTLLAIRYWPLPSPYGAMVAVGLVPVAVNVACFAVVIHRYKRSLNDPEHLLRDDRLVKASFVVGVPFAGVALYQGLPILAGLLAS